MTYLKLGVISSLFLLFSFGCSMEKEVKNQQNADKSVLVNREIPEDIRRLIKSNNDIVFQAFKQHAYPLLITVASDGLAAHKYDLADIVDVLQYLNKAESYRILDEYYVVNDTTDVKKILLSADSTYQMPLIFSSKESYISIMIPEPFDVDLIIFCVYGKYGNEWKLNIISAGQYSVYDKNVDQLAERIETNYKNGCLLNAAGDMAVATKLFAPCQYFKPVRIAEYKMMFSEINNAFLSKIKFPDTLQTENGDFIIKSMQSLELKGRGFYPKLNCVSMAPKKDSLIYYSQVTEVHKQLAEDLVCDLGKVNVLFQVCSSDPNDKICTPFFK